MTDKAWNSTPRGDGKPTGRLARQGKEPIPSTRCNYYIDGAIICDAFPSWPVPGTRRERRCEEHRGETQ